MNDYFEQLSIDVSLLNDDDKHLINTWYNHDKRYNIELFDKSLFDGHNDYIKQMGLSDIFDDYLVLWLDDTGCRAGIGIQGEHKGKILLIDETNSCAIRYYCLENFLNAIKNETIDDLYPFDDEGHYDCLITIFE